jgi:hypothetical protein
MTALLHDNSLSPEQPAVGHQSERNLPLLEVGFLASSQYLAKTVTVLQLPDATSCILTWNWEGHTIY